MKDVSELDLKLAKYKIDKLILTIEGYGEYEIKPTYVTSIVMEKDYENYNFPFFELFVGIPVAVYRAMKKENIKNYCYIRMKYAYFPVEAVSSTGHPDSNPPEKPYLTKNFFIYGIEGTPDNTEEAQEKIEKEIKADESPDNMNHMVSAYLLLYDEEKLKQVTRIVNEVITDCTLTDAVTRVLNSTGINKVLMTPADNCDIYHEFTLLPIRTDAQLHHICNDFHMHTTGTRIFFDFDCTYIVSRNLKCDAWRPKEYKKTYVIYDPPSVNGKRTQGCCEDDEDQSNYCTMCEFKLATPSYMEEQVYGLAYTHLDTKTGKLSPVVSDTQTTSKGKPSESRVIFNNSGDVRTREELQMTQEQNATVWEVAIDSFLIDFLSPNKEFELVFLTSKLAKYNGRYKISKFITNFEKGDGEWFTTITKATFAGKYIK